MMNEKLAENEKTKQLHFKLEAHKMLWNKSGLENIFMIK